jgi:hypothetical protein
MMMTASQRRLAEQYDDCLVRAVADRDFAHEFRTVVEGIAATVRSDAQLAIDGFVDYTPTLPSAPGPATEEFAIEYVQDPELEAALRERVIASRHDCYWTKIDVCFRRLRDGECTVYVSHIDELTGENYAIVVSGRRYRVVCSEVTEKMSRVSVRLFREILLRCLENAGGCFAHAAALCRRDAASGFLVIGDSGAGKSTTVWQLCRTGRFDYVSNDKSIVMLKEEIRIVSWPLAVRLGMGALKSSGRLHEYRSKGQFRQQEAELWTQRVDALEEKRSNWGNKVKLSLTPRELHAFEGIESRDSCRFSALLVPKLALGDGPLMVAETAFEPHRDMVLRNLLEPYDEDIGRGWLGLRTVDDDFLEARKADLVRRIDASPVYELRGDPERFPAEAERIADALAALC